MSTPRRQGLAPIAYLPGAALATVDDATLARELAAGDARAAREAWRRLGPLVRRILLRTLGPEAEIDDLAQDIFITLLDRVKTLRDPAMLRAFTMSIAANAIRHHLRWRWLRRWLVLPGNADALDLRTFQPSPEAREAVVRLYAILDKLGAVDRTAFTLRFIEELELKEVAAALDLSLATTKRRLARAWKRVALRVARDPALRDLLGTLPGAPTAADASAAEAGEVEVES